MIAHKFVEHKIPPLETLSGFWIYKLKEKVLAGEALTREEKDRLFVDMWSSSTFTKQGVCLHGWCFDFSQILKEYFVEFTYGHIQSVYAPDKTSIRNRLDSIRRIVEVGDV